MMKPTKLFRKLIAVLLAAVLLLPGPSISLAFAESTVRTGDVPEASEGCNREPCCASETDTNGLDPAKDEAPEPEYDLMAYVVHETPRDYRWFKINSYAFLHENELVSTVSMMEAGNLSYGAITEAEGKIYAAQGNTEYAKGQGCLYRLDGNFREEEEISLWIEHLDFDTAFFSYLWGVNCWSLTYSYEEQKCYALIELNFWDNQMNIPEGSNQIQLIGIAEVDLETGGMTFIGANWWRYVFVTGDAGGSLYDIWPVSMTYMGDGNFLMVEAWSNCLMSFNINDDLNFTESYNSIIQMPSPATSFGETGFPQLYAAQSLVYFPEDNTAVWCSEKHQFLSSPFMKFTRFDLNTQSYTFQNFLQPGCIINENSMHYQLPVLLCRVPEADPEPSPPSDDPEYDLLACATIFRQNASSNYYRFFNLNSKNPAEYEYLGEAQAPVALSGILEVGGQIYLNEYPQDHGVGSIYKLNDGFEIEHHASLWWEDDPGFSNGVGCWAWDYSEKEEKCYGLVNAYRLWGIAEIDLETGAFHYIFEPWDPLSCFNTDEFFWPVTMTYMEDGRFLVIDAWSNALLLIDTNIIDPTDIKAYKYICTMPELATWFPLLGCPERFMAQSMQYFEEDNTVLWGSGNTYDVHTNLVMVDVGTGEIVYDVSLHGEGMPLEPGEGEDEWNYLWPMAFCKLPKSEPAPPVLWGDVDNSGTVTIEDAMLTLRYCLGVLDSLDRIDLADMNGDGVINLLDAVMILRKAMGLITEP